MRLTPSRLTVPLRKSLSPTASLRSRLRTWSEKCPEVVAGWQRERLTFAGHVDSDVDVDVEVALLVGVDAELLIRPAPDEFGDVVEKEEQAKEGDEDGHEAPGF